MADKKEEKKKDTHTCILYIHGGRAGSEKYENEARQITTKNPDTYMHRRRGGGGGERAKGVKVRHKQSSRQKKKKTWMHAYHGGGVDG